MVAKPCRAQTATSNVEPTSEKALQTQQSTSTTDINNPTDKSLVPSDTVSQTSVKNPATAISNPRIPIPSRIFPALQQ